MSNINDSRALEFACAVGIDYAIAEMVTKRIPQKTYTTLRDGTIVPKDGDRKVFYILRRIANKKKVGGTLPLLLPEEEKEYLLDHNARESIEVLSYTAIHALYLRYKIKEVLGKNFPKEMNPVNLNDQEVDILIYWLF